MAFRKKWEQLLRYKPDILVIQECEHPDKYKDIEKIPGVSDFLWVGDNPNKGVAVISFGNITLKIADEYNPDFKYILPVEVSGGFNFRLWAVWAMPVKNNKRDSYVGQIWLAMMHYQSLSLNRTILIGDFNSNAIWDKEKKPINHSLLVNFLQEKGIESLYHLQSGALHGEELEPTFFLVKNRNKPYHLDYCFCSRDLLNKRCSISVGKYDDWIKFSDHMPLVIRLSGI